MLIHIEGHPLTLLWLAFGSSPLPPLPPVLAEETAQAQAAAARIGDIARWNDRTSPRKTLETFYFAITGYNRAPGLIVNAIDCLDLDGLDPVMRERDAALLAHQLEFVLNRQAIPLYSIPERPDEDRVVLDEMEGLPIVLARQPDGRWRFDAGTVGRIGKLRKLSSHGQRAAQEARAKLAEGRTDPATTFRTFAGAAMQDTLKNFFGTLLLIGEHPFRIGEHVAIQGMEGIVGLRSTRVRTFEDSLLTIPNSVMAAALIDNRAMRSCRRFRLLVSMAYGTPPDRMIALRDGLRAFASGHPKVRQDKVAIHIHDLGASSVDLLVQVYFGVATYTDELVCRDDFSREILAQADRLGVEIAFPTQTIHVAGLEAAGHAVPPPPKLLGRERPDARRLALSHVTDPASEP